MRLPKFAVALAELTLIFPAALFMFALFVRNLQPLQYEPAHTAQQIVTWYAARVHLGLWVFLIALPITVLLIGCVTLRRRWSDDEGLRQSARQISAALKVNSSTAMVLAATLASGSILGVVALHVLTD